jgi:acyl-lipid omega-6 desaturase (Delta-12 desaturase)
MTISAVKPNSQTSPLKLKHIVKALPRECFQKNQTKAWSMLAINVLMVCIGYVGLAIAPWYLLPLVWVFTGTGLTGFFVIGHDCGHRSFAKRRWVNDLVGHIFMLPLIYPFHGWRILHNYHHKHTNKLDEDNAWHPWKQEVYRDLNKPMQAFYQNLRGRLWWLASIIHWAGIHFDWNKFQGKQREQVKFSALLVIVTAAIGFPVLIATTGVWGFVKFWVIPWLVYHFWMSTFTLVHHTAPEIPFKPANQWDEAQAQLFGTVHCDYPRWVEFLCHDINVHIPHHISTAIPSYNLRLAHEVIRQKWAGQIHETRFSWDLMKRITDECHLYDPEKNYISCQDFLSP